MGARKIEEAVVKTLKEFKTDALVTRTGCIGFCAREPLLDMVLPGGPRISFGDMTPRKTRDMLSAYFTNGTIKTDHALGRFSSEEHVLTGEDHSYASSGAAGDIPEWSALDFYRRQKRVILRNCGSIDPMSIEESIARGGYRGALRALTAMKPEAVLEQITEIRASRQGRRVFPHRPEMAVRAERKGRHQICGVQRRRGRARFVNGPERARRRPARHHGRNDHRIIRDRRATGVCVRSQRISARDHHPRTRHRRSGKIRASGRKYFRQRVVV